MSDNENPTPPSVTPDGSTNLTEEQKQYTEQLGDGSSTDAPAEDNDTDHASGGDADDE